MDTRMWILVEVPDCVSVILLLLQTIFCYHGTASVCSTKELSWVRNVELNWERCYSPFISYCWPLLALYRKQKKPRRIIIDDFIAWRFSSELLDPVGSHFKICLDFLATSISLSILWDTLWYLLDVTDPGRTLSALLSIVILFLC